MPDDLLPRAPLLLLIEQIGLAEYPGLSALAYTPPSQPHLRAAIARRAQRSLLLRLLAFRPWHATELCQLQLGQTLVRDDGTGYVVVSSAEHGLDWCAGLQPSDQRLQLPGALAAAMEEYVNIWRPMLSLNDDEPLFITRRGTSYTISALNREVGCSLWRYTRRSISLPQIRQLWISNDAPGLSGWRGRVTVAGRRGLASAVRRFSPPASVVDR